MTKLANTDSLIIRQHIKWAEVFTGFEMKNAYDILDTDGNQLYLAAETKSNFFARLFLRSFRAFEIVVFDETKNPVFKFRRKFKFIFHEISVFDRFDQLLGEAKLQFALFSRKFIISDKYSNPVFTLFGPVFKPWTFYIRQSEQDVGYIVKRWNGMLKELFTTADNFGIQFPPGISEEIKGLLLGVVFLIDFVYFESHR